MLVSEASGDQKGIGCQGLNLSKSCPWVSNINLSGLSVPVSVIWQQRFLPLWFVMRIRYVHVTLHKVSCKHVHTGSQPDSCRKETWPGSSLPPEGMSDCITCAQEKTEEREKARRESSYCFKLGAGGVSPRPAPHFVLSTRQRPLSHSIY